MRHDEQEELILNLIENHPDLIDDEQIKRYQMLNTKVDLVLSMIRARNKKKIKKTA